MESKNLKDYLKWKNVNGGSFSLFDYLHGVLSTKNLHPDCIIALLELIHPTFVEKDGYIIVKEELIGEKLEQFQSGDLEKGEVEYWTNLINIDGVLPNFSFEFYSTILEIMSNTWRAKLDKDFPSKNFKVKCFIEDSNEFFITFTQV